MIADEIEQRPVTVKRPSDCTAEELAAFCNLVVDGGEVAEDGLPDRVRNAKTLSFLYDGDKLIGVAALKTPDQTYRRRTFQKANSDLSPESFPHELGWIVVSENYREKRLSGKLVESLMRTANFNVYATSNTKNERMHKGLRRFGFIRVGENYKSVENPGDKVSLFVWRHKAGQQCSEDGR